MMSYGSKVLFYVLISAVLLVPLDADTLEEDCTIELQVHRNTVYKAILGHQLKIECPVKLCNNSPPTVYWYKMEDKRVPLIANNNSRITTEWEGKHPLKGTSYLIFQNIISGDSGGYRCESGDSVSHIINIIVNVTNQDTNNTKKPMINDTTDQPKTKPTNNFLMYMYSAAGIGCFVIIVIIISLICMRGCKGKSRKEKKNENQYMEIPLAERDIPNTIGLHFSPRGSLTQSNATQAEELSSVMYAVFNHGLPPREAPRPQKQIEETEEPVTSGHIPTSS